MASFIFVCDPHFSDKGPSTRIDDYCEAILSKMQFIIDFGNQNKIPFIVLAGDIFHRKIPSHNSHFLVRRLIDIFSSFAGRIFCIAGNHDFSGNIDSLFKQPLSVLIETGNLEFLTDDNPLLLEHEGISFSLGGKSFSTDLDDPHAGSLYNLTHDTKADYRIGVFHQMILPDGQTFFNEYINFSELKNINSDLVLVGHYHVGFEPTAVEYKRDDYKNMYFVNCGSLARGSSDQFNLDKKPKFVVCSFNRIEGEIIPTFEDVIVPHKLSSEVFDLTAIAKKKENESLKVFVQNLSEFEANSLQSSDPDSVINILKVMECPKDLLPLAKFYLEQSYAQINGG